MEILITPEDIGYSAAIPTLHIYTQGDTFDELLHNLYEALELYYEEEKEYVLNNLQQSTFYFSLPTTYHANSVQGARSHSVIA